MNRKSRSIGRRSSILKIDLNNKDEDTGIIFNNKNRRASRRVSFAETYQVKEFPRDSPRVWKGLTDDENNVSDENQPGKSGTAAAQDTSITGLDKLLTGTIQTQPYQNVTDFPIPEVSSDSFNLFDMNKTVVESVDMEMTQTVGSFEIDFGTEPSREIKFDASSFLKSLGSKPSESMQPMQIYSPHREKTESSTTNLNSSLTVKPVRSPLKGLSIQQNITFSQQDKENMMMPTEMFNNFNPVLDTEEPQSLVDARTFLNKFFGPQDEDPVGYLRTKTQTEEIMDDMDETTCYGGIEGELTKSKASSNPGKENFQLQISASHDDDEVTKYYNPEDETVSIEETKCIGGILSGFADQNMTAPSPGNYTINQSMTMENKASVNGVLSRTSPVNLTMNQTMGMEETKSIGGILSRTSPANLTVNQTMGMDETKSIGGILSRTSPVNFTVNQTVDMEETQPVCNNRLRTSQSPANLTVNQTIGMEETKSIGGILSRTSPANLTVNQTMGMEETKSIGGILSRTSPANLTLNQTVGMEETKSIGGILSRTSLTNLTVNQTMGMEETKSIGGILSRTSPENLTINQTIRMEETKSIGGILSRTSPANLTVNQTMGMEETKSIGGILSRTSPTNLTVNQTMGMEETNSIGGILSRTSPENLTMNQTIGIEETKSIGGILSRTSPVNFTVNQTVDMEETQPVCNNRLRTSQSSSIVSRAAIIDLTNQTMAMEETKPVGGILNKSANPSMNADVMDVRNYWSVDQETKIKNAYVAVERNADSKQFANASQQNFGLEILKNNSGVFDKTTQQTLCMEETKPVGGVLNKLSQSNIMMENAKSNEISLNDNVTKNFKSGDDEMMHFEETTCVGGILNLNETLNKHRDLDNRTIDMEVMKTMGTIFDKESNKGSSLNFAHSGDRTLCHEEVKTDKVHNDINTARYVLQNEIILSNKASGTPASLPNKSIHMEETKCVGGVLNNETLQHRKGDDGCKVGTAGDKIPNFTMVEQTKMEETTCIGGIMDSVAANKTDQVISDENGGTVFGEEVSVNHDITMTDPNMKLESQQGHLHFGKNDEYVVDDEITFKNSNKRSFGDLKDDKESEAVDDKTKDFTQSQTKLQKLREMLMLSKQKTAAQLRAGVIKTPSKLSPSLLNVTSSNSNTEVLDISQSRSPAHKKQRISSEVMEMDDTKADFTERTDALMMGYQDTGGLTEDLTGNRRLKEDNTQDITAGIDDEKMPDDMHVDLCASGYNETTHSQTHSDPSFTTGHSGSLSHSDTHSDSRSQMSMLSSKSFASSFIIPDGPLSLESFFKLTLKPASKVKFGGRCSKVFSQKINTDDLGELLQAEFTLVPLVLAKKKAMEKLKERTDKNVESVDWLQKTLEEVQPQIFQDCVNASDDELKEITEHLRLLTSCCYNEAEREWKNVTTSLYTEALHNVQDLGCCKANGILDKIKSDNKTVEQLLSSLDNDLTELEKVGERLDNLQQKQHVLTSQVDHAKASLSNKMAVEKSLRDQISKHDERRCSDTERENLRQQIQAHLVCAEWNLDELQDDFIVFTFFDGEMVLKINMVPGDKEKLVQSISLKSLINTATSRLHKRMAHSLAVAGIDTSSLMQRYNTYSALPGLLREVSTIISEINSFCVDVKKVNFDRKLKIRDLVVSVDLWSLDTLDLVNVSFKLNPCRPITDPVHTSVKVSIGHTRSDEIEAILCDVAPGHRYLSRLVEAVDFSKLHH